jgi:hypothetical protein
MPRANRYHLPGHAWHLTHRCHQREFLLKFARDRDGIRGSDPRNLHSGVGPTQLLDLSGERSGKPYFSRLKAPFSMPEWTVESGGSTECPARIATTCLVMSGDGSRGRTHATS